jgi:hypothetical protein
MNNKNDFSEELRGKAFVQLLEFIKKQDDLIHSWTKYFLTIQAGLAIALAFLLKMTTEKSDLLVKVGSLFLPVLGIATTICLTNIIIHEHKWQGRYIKSLKNLPNIPVIYEIDPDPEKPGYIAKQFLWLRWVLIIGWAIIAVISLF